MTGLLRRSGHALRIVAISVAGAVIYGLIHDQVTIRVCPQYFTVTHPKVTDSTNLTVIALIWGVIATWWMGVILGIPLAVTATLGTWPVYPRIVRAIAWLLIVMGVLALVAGITGYVLARRDAITIPHDLAREIPRAMHDRWLAAWCAHNASYGFGALGAIVLALYVPIARWRLARKQPRVA